ncbi:hypothetical protein DL93DRAFT_1957136 [Clavulina sp. PMI_390]|nr:hypothetical protein DL93DRAFT_1957136 [Clavulina sp. PMI_390]
MLYFYKLVISSISVIYYFAAPNGAVIVECMPCPVALAAFHFFPCCLPSVFRIQYCNH